MSESKKRRNRTRVRNASLRCTRRGGKARAHHSMRLSGPFESAEFNARSIAHKGQRRLSEHTGPTTPQDDSGVAQNARLMSESKKRRNRTRIRNASLRCTRRGGKVSQGQFCGRFFGPAFEKSFVLKNVFKFMFLFYEEGYDFNK